MLDIKLITENPELVAKRLAKKGYNVDFSPVISWNEERKSLITQNETLKAERNKVSASIPALKKQGLPVDDIFAQMRTLGETIAKGDEKVKELDAQIFDFVSRLPNMPDDDLLEGEKENNAVVKVYGEKPEFTFKAKNHVIAFFC